jgi:histidinol dehydrogenase
MNSERELLPRRDLEAAIAARRRLAVGEARVRRAVAEIVEAVAAEGDAAVLRYAERFDGARPRPLVLGEEALARARQRVPPTLLADLQTVSRRVRAYAARFDQPAEALPRRDESGYLSGERERPVGRAGVYVPGGTAPLVSSVLMTAGFAQAAGVPDIWLATPARGGADAEEAIHPGILAAAALVGVGHVLAAGGAQAIAALALGTESVTAVDVVAGPGNAYVTEAKRQVFGIVGVDGVAGPSEVVVVVDDDADPDLAAADLLAQAEHDARAWPALISVGEAAGRRVLAALAPALETLPRRALAREALAHGAWIVADDAASAVTAAGRLAPEHLELYVREPERHLDRVAAAGAVFLGGMPETLGDYVVGPSHVLPTGAAARFSGPLNVQTFRTRMSVLGAPPDGLGPLGKAAARLARIEGLEGHARAVERRLGP